MSAIQFESARVETDVEWQEEVGKRTIATLEAYGPRPGAPELAILGLVHAVENQREGTDMAAFRVSNYLLTRFDPVCHLFNAAGNCTLKVPGVELKRTFSGNQFPRLSAREWLFSDDD